jgi:DNA-binding NtrC family response regulator
LVELKLQMEELRRRMDDEPRRVEVMEVAPRPSFEDFQVGEVIEVGGHGEAPSDEIRHRVVYQPGMKMADVERAAIEAALQETRGNRRRAADKLGIGERTLYRKIKEYELG